MSREILDKAREALIGKFGESRGSSVARVVLPNVVADFCRMMSREEPGIPNTEVYRIENSNVALRVNGRVEMTDGRREVVLTGIELEEY